MLPVSLLFERLAARSVRSLVWLTFNALLACLLFTDGFNFYAKMRAAVGSIDELNEREKTFDRLLPGFAKNSFPRSTFFRVSRRS